MRISRFIFSSAWLVISLLAISCSVEPELLNYGKDECHFCKMTLMDEKFGAEIVTKKGKVFKFDDANCMINYLTKNITDERDVEFKLITDYTQPGKLIEANIAFYIKDNEIHAPMNSQVAAFEDYEVMSKFKKKWNGIYLSWGELVTQFK